MNAHIGSFEDRIKAEAKARRIRLMGITKPVNYKPEPKPLVPMCYRSYKRPVREEDQHVKLWRWYLLNKQLYEVVIASVGEATMCKDLLVQCDENSFKNIVKDTLKKLDSPYTFNDLIGYRRNVDLVNHRHICYFEVQRRRGDLSYPAMARLFKRDHSSILYAIRKVRESGFTGL